jgi:hypothetical protein
MKDNPRSEPTPEEIKHLLQEAILRNYPNPERRGCSHQQTLRALGTKRLPHEDPHWEHITHCSPCYQEFLEYRAAALDSRRSRGRIAGVAGTIAAVALIVAIWLSTTRPAPKVPSNAANRPPVPTAPGPAEGQPLTAVLNMQASPTRGSERTPVGPGDLQRLPRGRMAPLLIYLPFGSEPGTYKVEVLRDGSSGEPLATFTGAAEIRDGLTVLQVSPDLSPLGPGTYIFSVSRNGSDPTTCRVVLQ